MTLSGTSAQHCERAGQYRDDLLWDIRSFRGMVRDADGPKRKADHARAALHNIDSKLYTLKSELRWVDDTCAGLPSFVSATKSANKFKGDMFEVRGNVNSLDGFSFFSVPMMAWPIYLGVGAAGLWALKAMDKPDPDKKKKAKKKKAKRK